MGNYDAHHSREVKLPVGLPGNPHEWPVRLLPGLSRKGKSEIIDIDSLRPAKAPGEMVVGRGAECLAEAVIVALALLLLPLRKSGLMNAELAGPLAPPIVRECCVELIDRRLIVRQQQQRQRPS